MHDMDENKEKSGDQIKVIMYAIKERRYDDDNKDAKMDLDMKTNKLKRKDSKMN
jgi:hypothetical protein